MSAVSTETPDTLVNKPGYKVPEKSKAIYTSDDEDDHQSYAEYSDTDEDASESEEEIEFHEVTEPLYNPNMRNYEDEHGFTVNVRTDDEYSDDTTDSEYIEEKKRQSQMIAPEAMHHLANQDTDSESEYEDKIGAVYKSEVSRNFSNHSEQEHTSYRQSIESMSATGSNHSESEIGQNTTAAFATKSNNRNSFTIRPRSHKITPLESLQSTDNSDSDGEDEYEQHQSLPKNRPKSNLRNSVSVRPNSHRPAARESFQSTDASISENEQAVNDFVTMDLSERPISQRSAVRNSFQSTDASVSDNEEQRDTFVPMASPERPKSSIRHSTSVRRSSQRIITPIDAQLVQDLSSYLEPKQQITVEESDNSRDTEKYVAEAQETPLKNAPMNKRNSISSADSNEDDAEHGFDPTEYGMDLDDDVEHHSHRSSYLSDQKIGHKEDDIVHKYSEDKVPETSSSHSAEGVHSTSVSDFESDASADTALTTPKTEIEPLDDVKKTAMTFTPHQNLADEPVQTTSPKDYVDYLEELEQTPELPPKDGMSKVSAAAMSNRFSIQSLSELKEISLDQPAPPAKDFPSTSQDQGYTLPSYNRNNRHSKTLPPIDTSMGTGRQSTSSEQSSPRSGILSNAFRLQTPVTFSNPFKRSPPSSTVTTPRTSISTIHTRPSQAYSARQSKRMSKQLGLASPVVGGSVDEMLLARLEQQNTELRKDPKNRVLQNLQREAVRRSVENLKQDKANKGVDGEGDYDWGNVSLLAFGFGRLAWLAK
jgi:hypothetical protein